MLFYSVILINSIYKIKDSVFLLKIGQIVNYIWDSLLFVFKFLIKFIYFPYILNNKAFVIPNELNHSIVNVIHNERFWVLRLKLWIQNYKFLRLNKFLQIQFHDRLFFLFRSIFLMFLHRFLCFLLYLFGSFLRSLPCFLVL